MNPERSATPAIQLWSTTSTSSAPPLPPPADTPPEPATSPSDWPPHPPLPVSATPTISPPSETIDDLGLTWGPFPPMPGHAINLFQAGARIALKNIETLFLQHPSADLVEIVKGLMDSTDDKIAVEAARMPSEKNWMLEGKKWANERFGRNWMTMVGGADKAACDAWVQQRGDPSWKAYDRSVGAAHSAMEGLRGVGESKLVECVVRVLERWIKLHVEAAQKEECPRLGLGS